MSRPPTRIEELNKLLRPIFYRVILDYVFNYQGRATAVGKVNKKIKFKFEQRDMSWAAYVSSLC